MGQLDKQPDNVGAGDPQAADALLRAMTQDIENLRRNLIGQLQTDIERLQREKSQLIEDIEQLKAQRQQHLLQQQQVVRQIAPAVVNQLQELVTSRLNQIAGSSRVSYPDATLGEPVGQNQRKQLNGIPNAENLAASPLKNSNENVDHWITSLDSTLRATFSALQQDLKSYQSALSQQIGQMYSLEKQGEAILEALVNRLKKEIQSDALTRKTSPPPPPAQTDYSYSYRDASGYSDSNHNLNHTTVSYPPESSLPVVPPSAEPEPPSVAPQPQPTAKRQFGLIIVLISSLLLAFQNVLLAVIFNKSPIFGQFELGGFITPDVGNSLLILWLRMLVVVPLMALLGTLLYPAVWRDIKQFAQSKDWPVFLNILISGFFLFLSQVLLYLALGSLAPGIVIAIYFIYPIFTKLLAWVLFGVRPTLVSNLVIFSVLVGFILITLPGSPTAELSSLGISAAAGAGIACACHEILSQAPARKLKPVPLFWINNVIILVFAGLSLAGPFPESWRFDVVPTMWPSLILCSLVLAGTTLISYLLNNIGLRMVDAVKASIVGASLPALTALLAFFIIQSRLEFQQIFGLLLVTLGVITLSIERWRRHAKATQPAGGANQRRR